jgi:hypothetical protein
MLAKKRLGNAENGKSGKKRRNEVRSGKHDGKVKDGRYKI